ncbi:MAG TPA: tRNA uridine-5-carboxymethylaminomethyl(34) synthesis GTPase MnmE [Opitutaceae bacterium]
MNAPLETIAAMGTPVGTSALAVVRVSGPQAKPLAQTIVGRELEPRHATVTLYKDLIGVGVDEVVLTLFVKPSSYTGEDLLEISSHGNPYIAQRILEDLLARGCRLAEPGEFTRQAFLNGRMDLSQAEAVMDLIAARSERALEAANRQLRGSISRQMKVLCDTLVQALARVEAYIDFPEEDLPDENRAQLSSMVAELRSRTGRLLATQHYGEVLRGGLRVAIVGEPNAGKSSLLNRLLGRDRAIVSPEPGTTRDFIEEPLMIGPYLFRLVDTAGLNPSPGAVEQLGMEKTRRWIEEADIILLLLDATRPGAGPLELAERGALVVTNKSDLMPPAASPALPISALTGDGLETLRAALVARADALQPQMGEDQVAINARHAHALRDAEMCLAAAAEKLGAKTDDSVLLASDLRGALEAFGRIAGRVDHERVLDELFASFCIGK